MDTRIDWQKAVGMAEGSDRDRELANGLKQLPYLDGAEREHEVRRLIEAEYSLEEDGLQKVTFARLRALLSLDDEGAMRVAEAYDSVMNSMPGEIAFRRAAVEQTIARHRFSVEEEARLRALMPNVFGEKPAELSVGTPGPQEPVQPYPRRRWWQFWGSKRADAQKSADVVAEDIASRIEEQRAPQSEAARDQFSRNRPA